MAVLPGLPPHCSSARIMLSSTCCSSSVAIALRDICFSHRCVSARKCNRSASGSTVKGVPSIAA
eukprot:scaffold161699_cov38-Attheya_sp.AAC.1